MKLTQDGFASPSSDRPQSESPRNCFRGVHWMCCVVLCRAESSRSEMSRAEKSGVEMRRSLILPQMLELFRRRQLRQPHVFRGQRAFVNGHFNLHLIG